MKNAEKQEEFRAVYSDMRNKWQKEMVAKQAANTLEEEKKDADEEEPDANTFRNILEGKEELTDDKMQELMGQWMQEAGQMEDMNKMMEAWGNSWAEADELQMARDPTVLTF